MRGHSPENESNLRRALVNVASTLHVVPTKYWSYFRSERHVSEGAPDWAHCLCMYSELACGRASVECMRRQCALFYACEAVSATIRKRGKNFRTEFSHRGAEL